MTIKQLRAKTGLSQAKFGKKYGIPLNTIKNWECEDGKPNHRDCPEYVLYLLERAVMEDAMTELEVNDYVAAAEEALKDDPTFNSYFSALVKERENLAENGCHSGTIEGILFSIWNQRIGYILEHLEEIRASIPKD